MNIYHSISAFKKTAPAVVTIGTFDGVHFGHQKIIKRLKQEAEAIGGSSVILTFFPHPRTIISPEDQSVKMINTMDEKAAILAELGVDHLIITPFTRDFSNLSPEEYIQSILVDTIGIKKIIIGYDHRFGKDRLGDLNTLKRAAQKFDFEVEEIPEQDVNDVAVSSTKIRAALMQGDFSLAKQYLGYDFSLYGRVIKGDKIGRTLGFPTANLFIEENYKLIPNDGIYAVTVEMENPHAAHEMLEFKGMAYIGHRPTINGMTRNIEVNIFDFDQEIYGQYIKMSFLKYLRADMKLAGLEELKLQMQKDRQATVDYFQSL